MAAENRDDSPKVRLAQDYILVQPDASAVQVPVNLVGTPTSTVKASLGLFSQDGKLISSDLTATWEPGSSSTVNVDIPGIKNLLGGARRSVLVRFLTVMNAVLDDKDGSTGLVSLDPDLPRFRFQPNGAAYPDQNPRPKIDIILESGWIKQPATLRYQLYQLTSSKQKFLQSSGAVGFLQVASNAAAKPGDIAATVEVPIEWDAVPESAQYRIRMELEGFYASWTADQSGDVALHVFGVDPGTCPPGSAVKDKGRNGTPASETVESWRADSGTAGPIEILPDGGTLALFAGHAPVPLSTRTLKDTKTVQVGAMVGINVTQATLCITKSAVQVVVPLGAGTTSTSSASQPTISTSTVGLCSGAAWDLPLFPGPNSFTISPVELSVVRLADPSHARVLSLEAKGLDGSVVVVCGPPALELGGSSQSSSEVGYSTIDVKSAEQDESEGQNIAATAAVAAAAGDLSGETIGGKEHVAEEGTSSSSLLVGSEGSGNIDVDTAVQMVALDAWRSCTPGVTMGITVPASTDTISLIPTLLHPEIQNVRVEVNGQVLSRGGDVGADQQADTAATGRTTATTNSSVNNTASSNSINSTSSSSGELPAAFIMGMQPGVAVEIDVVVIAEDGVTSTHYPVTITREMGETNGTGDRGGNVTYGSAEDVRRQKGWPPSPAELSNCKICPPGWSSATRDASSCEMCPPGTSASKEGSGECSPCGPGTFSLPWGSTHCKHCISGTHASSERATSCRMCPEGTTTIEDGQPVCNVTLAPATDLKVRYAVVVYFSVNLTGSDPEDIVLRAGVNAPAESIVSNLLRTDTAAAFNISMQDVQVLSVHRVARRTLQAKVSATLGVDLPGNATEEDIAAALEVQKLSADRPIELLSQDPDSFFGRTTKTLDVGVEAGGDVEKVEHRPHLEAPFPRWALIGPGLGGAIAGACLIFASRWKKRGRHTTAWMHTLRTTSASQRYIRHP